MWREGGVFELGNTVAKARLKQFWNSSLKKGVKKMCLSSSGCSFFLEQLIKI